MDIFSSYNNYSLPINAAGVYSVSFTDYSLDSTGTDTRVL